MSSRGPSQDKVKRAAPLTLLCPLALVSARSEEVEIRLRIERPGYQRYPESRAIKQKAQKAAGNSKWVSLSRQACPLTVTALDIYIDTQQTPFPLCRLSLQYSRTWQHWRDQPTEASPISSPLAAQQQAPS